MSTPAPVTRETQIAALRQAVILARWARENLASAAQLLKANNLPGDADNLDGTVSIVDVDIRLLNNALHTMVTS